jgi:serine phosphatase RsbU (regulator of sigma subunit)/PAS domain-containing protein
VNASADRPVGARRSPGQVAADELLSDPNRVSEARRLVPTGGTTTLDRLAGLATRLLAAQEAHISLLTDVEVVSAAYGLPPGTVGTETPLHESVCSVLNATGAGDRLGSRLGTPLTADDGHVVGALCVHAPEPRDWSSSDAKTLRQLSEAVVTELELSAVVRRYESDRVRWDLATDAAGIGTFDWDLRTGRLSWDERLIAMFGYDDGDFDQSIEAFNARLHPDDLPRVSEALAGSIDTCGDFETEYRVLLPSGDTRWVHARGRALRGDDGAAERLLGAAYDTTGEHAGAAQVARVLEAMPAGFYSLDREWRFTHVNAEAERLLSRTREDLLGKSLWDEWPATVGGVLEQKYRAAVSTGQPVSFDTYYPAPLNGWYEVRAWPTPDGLSVYSLEVTDRRLTQQRAERAAQRLAILARVSAELAGTLDATMAVAQLPRFVVPGLADFCIATVVEPDGRPRDIGSWHADRASRALLERYAAVRLETMPASSPVARALLGGESAREDGPALLDMLPPGEARDLLNVLRPDSAIALPMRGRGRTLGLLTLYRRSGAVMTDDDLTTAQDVADRAGLALDNARLYNAQQQLAEGLQRSLLTEPPQPDHGEIAVRYLPAAEAARVGGDWYDAFLQPSGATMLVIGDVVGHDTEAAAAMGQLRGLLRGIATYSDAEPAEVLRGLDASMTTLQTRTLATAAVARFEQTAEEAERGVTRMRWANAGHLPPLVVNPDGSVAELAAWKGDLLLGVDPEARRQESTVTLDRGATVLLYTDGLVERRDADLDTGMVRLRDAVVELAHLPLEEMLDELIERMVDGRPEDDVAVVAVRLHRQDLPRPAEAGPNDVPPDVPEDVTS